MAPRGRGKLKDLSVLETWPLWAFVPIMLLTVPLQFSAELLGSKISSAYDGMVETFGRNEALANGFCFQVGTSANDWGDCGNTVFFVGETATLGHFGLLSGAPSEPVSVSVTDRRLCFQVGTSANVSWGDCANTATLGHFGLLSGAPSEPVSVSATDRPPTRFVEGYHGPALALSFRWRKTSPSNRTTRFFPFYRLPTVWPSVWPSVFSAGPDSNMTSFRAPGTAWTAQPIRRSGSWTESSTLQCPAPDTRAHFLEGVIRTRLQCSLDSAPSPKAPAKPNPTPRVLKVRLIFFLFDDAPPRVGGCASKRQRKKQKKEKKEKARLKRQQEEKKQIAWFHAWTKRQQEKKDRGKKSAQDRTKVPETENPRYESPRAISLRIALAECFIWCFVDDMLLADVLRFGVILLVTTAPSVYDRVFPTTPSCFCCCFCCQQQAASAAASSVDLGLVDSARSVAQNDQVVFFMMSFCVFTVH